MQLAYWTTPLLCFRITRSTRKGIMNDTISAICYLLRLPVTILRPFKRHTKQTRYTNVELNWTCLCAVTAKVRSVPKYVYSLGHTACIYILLNIDSHCHGVKVPLPYQFPGCKMACHAFWRISPLLLKVHSTLVVAVVSIETSSLPQSTSDHCILWCINECP